MTRRQIESILRTQSYQDAANTIHKAFKDNELTWFIVSATLACAAGIMAVVLVAQI
jgi:hypothetical protein